MICRGCAGSGVGQHVPTRLAGFNSVTRGPKPGSERYFATMHIGPHDENIGWRPLAVVLAWVEEARAEGREVTISGTTFRDGKYAGRMPSVPFFWTAEHVCGWCHGTGVPQLSVHTLEQGCAL